MSRYAVLLRGINLAGRNRVPMGELRQACESVGCTEVATYIQSGNAVLSSDLGEGVLRDRLREAVEQRTGVAAPVLVRTAAELAAVAVAVPFPQAEPAAVHVAFFPEPQDPAWFDDAAAPPEELAVAGREVYLHLPNGLGRSPLARQVERRGRGGCTVRNWRTVTTLARMSAS